MEVSMSRAHLGITGIVLLALLALPRAAGASIIDIIWEMSGPQMVGAVAECRLDLRTEKTECRVVDKRISGALDSRATRRLWLDLQGAVYFSTGKDSPDRKYTFGDTGMLKFEPMFHVQSYRAHDKDFSIYHGVMGLSYDFLFGKHFRRFDNAGLKLSPIGVTMGRVDVAFNMRFYPSGFTPNEFGAKTAISNPNSRRETLRKGISAGYTW
jgi:hypothetical protein